MYAHGIVPATSGLSEMQENFWLRMERDHAPFVVGDSFGDEPEEKLSLSKVM